MTTIYFATDVHGSDVCWLKFLSAAKFYQAEIIILGGDLTGKAIVPIIHQGNNTFKAVLMEQETILHGRDEVEAMAKRVRSRGYYPYATTPDEMAELAASPDRVSALFHQEVLRTVEQWMALADMRLKESGVRCFVAPGNDDVFEVDEVIRSSRCVTLAEGEVVELDGRYQMISSGYTNPTPWHTYREESEEQLLARYLAMTGQLKDPRRAVFNLHVPPYGSSLDDAPEMTADLRPKYAGNALVPVGSKSARQLIEKCQPALSLHGHIHEGRGATRIGKTLCINPGSMYEQGSLLGALIKLGKDKVDHYLLTTG